MRPITLQMVATINAIRICDNCAIMGYPDSGVHGYGMVHTIKADSRRKDDHNKMETCDAQHIYQKAGIARYTD